MMPKYLFEIKYLGDGVRGLQKEGGSSRRAAIEKLAESVGGRIEAFYYAFGDTDLFAIVECPDNSGAIAVALISGASGTVQVKTTVLIEPEEIDRASGMTPVFRPAGT